MVILSDIMFSSGYLHKSSGLLLCYVVFPIKMPIAISGETQLQMPIEKDPD